MDYMFSYDDGFANQIREMNMAISRDVARQCDERDKAIKEAFNFQYFMKTAVLQHNQEMNMIRGAIATDFGNEQYVSPAEYHSGDAGRKRETSEYIDAYEQASVKNRQVTKPTEVGENEPIYSEYTTHIVTKGPMKKMSYLSDEKENPKITELRKKQGKSQEKPTYFHAIVRHSDDKLLYCHRISATDANS